MYRTSLIIFLAMLFCLPQAQAQKNVQAYIDSLQKEVAVATDSGKVTMLTELSFQYSQTSPNEGLAAGRQGLALAELHGWRTQAANLTRGMGVDYLTLSDYPNALKYFNKSLDIFTALNSHKGMARCYINIANVYREQSNYPAAIEYYLRTLKENETIGDKIAISAAMANIGATYLDEKDYAHAISYTTQALEMNRAIGDKNRIASNLMNLGLIYKDESDYPKSLEYLFQTLALNEESGDETNRARVLGNIGMVYQGEKKYTTALGYLFQALQLDSALQYKRGRAINLGAVGEIYLSLAKDSSNTSIDSMVPKSRAGNLARATKYLDEAIAICREIGNIYSLGGFLDDRSNAQALAGDYAAAYTTYKERILYKDSIFSEEKNKAFTRNELRYEFSRREDSLQFRKALTDRQLSEQTLLNTQQQQALHLNRQQLLLANKEADFRRLAYLKTQADLQLEQSKRTANERALKIASNENALQNTTMTLQQTKLALQKRELQARSTQRNVIMGGLAAILLFGGFSFSRYQRQKRLEKNQAVLAERLRISRDLHDDMGATLSSISVYSTAVKQRMADGRNAEANTMLDTISGDARDMVSNMSDMVWMINPQNDLMEKLFDRMQLLASNVLASQNVLVHFSADEHLGKQILSMEVRKAIFLIFKEAVNNIAKYAACTDVRISLQQAGASLRMTISDNGRGFNAATDFSGNGLRNMRERAQELGGECLVNSAAGQGTTVSLTCTPHY